MEVRHRRKETAETATKQQQEKQKSSKSTKKTSQKGSGGRVFMGFFYLTFLLGLATFTFLIAPFIKLNLSKQINCSYIE